MAPPLRRHWEKKAGRRRTCAPMSEFEKKKNSAIGPLDVAAHLRCVGDALHGDVERRVEFEAIRGPVKYVAASNGVISSVGIFGVRGAPMSSEGFPWRSSGTPAPYPCGRHD